MRRALIAFITSLGAALLLPAGSLANITEIGQLPTNSTPSATPSCPNTPCLAVSRTTGYQAKFGTMHPVMAVPKPGGRIVAWTIALGKPTAKQITFFDTNEGGTASAGIAVLRPGPKLNYTLVAESPLMQLAPFFGTTVQFPLDTTLVVKTGDVIALTVPTWAPALALGFPSDTSWRASRGRGKCNDLATQTAQTQIGTTVQYFCLYKTARLTYSATFIPTPQPPTTTTTTPKQTSRKPTKTG